MAFALAVVTLGAFAWFVRPLLGPDRNHRGGEGWRLMEVIQEHEGLDPDGRRTYAERSLDRVSWYAGPVALAGGIAGLAIVARRLVVGSVGPAEIVTAGLVTPYLLLYLYLPSVDADHPWFIRRYVPTAIPGLLLFAGVATGAAVAWRGWPTTQSRFGGKGRPGDRMRGLDRSSNASWPLRAVTWQAGARDGVERLCAQFLPGSVAVLAADERVGLTVLPAVRTYCEVEAVAIRPDLLGASAAPVVVEVADAVARRPDPAAVEVVAPTRQVLMSASRPARPMCGRW